MIQSNSQYGRRLPRHRRGSSVMEMSLVMSILLMLSFGVVEYGYFFFIKNTVQGAAQAGARAAIPSTATNANVTTAVSNALSAAGLTSASFTVTLSPTDVSTAAAGASITVTVTGSWGTVGLHALPTSLGGISNTKNVVGAAVMRKEST